MVDLICRKTMMLCQTPGMCSPHGGCQPSVLKSADVRYSASSSPVTDTDQARLLEVLSFLAALRDVHPDMARWGLHGGCFRVYLVLKQRFPDAQPWYDSSHVLTKIGDAFYDIRGQVEPVSIVGAPYLPMDRLEFNRAYSWEGMPHAFACPQGFVMIHQDLLADLMDQEPLNADQQERLQKCLQEVAHG